MSSQANAVTSTAANETAAASSTAPTLQLNQHAIKFTGQGSEYFRIWIVNLLLTLLTLGIYSAWAKVRKLQYFYRNTQLDGSVFNYHGRPLAILKGRVIALLLIIAYNAAFKLSVWLALVAALVIIAILPRLLLQSLRFSAHNSSYRGLRFQFVGQVRNAYLVFGIPIAVVLGIGLVFTWATLQSGSSTIQGVMIGIAVLAQLSIVVLAPWLYFRVKNFQHNNFCYGQAISRFRGKAKKFYEIAILAFVLVVGIGGGLSSAMFLAFAVTQSALASKSGAIVFVVVLMFVSVLTFVAFLAALPFVQARLQNYIWNQTTLGRVGFESHLKARRLIWVSLTNMVLIVLTLGLFIPFAAVRLHRLRIEAVNVVLVGTLGTYIAQQTSSVGATGEGAADLLDLDFGL